MVTTMAPSPASAHTNCFDRNAYSDPKRSRAITADAENTITTPTNTSSMVTVNSQRSTLTRFAMGNSFHHGSAETRRKKLPIVDFQVLTVLVPAERLIPEHQRNAIRASQSLAGKRLESTFSKGKHSFVRTARPNPGCSRTHVLSQSVSELSDCDLFKSNRPRLCILIVTQSRAEISDLLIGEQPGERSERLIRIRHVFETYAPKLEIREISGALARRVNIDREADNRPRITRVGSTKCVEDLSYCVVLQVQ